MTPKATGMPVSIAASWRPLAASLAIRSKCGVSPRMMHPSARTHEKRRVFASASAVSGSSNAPGTGTTVIASSETLQSRSAESALSSRPVVMSPLKRLTTTATLRRKPCGPPSRTSTPGGIASRPGACSAVSGSRREILFRLRLLLLLLFDDHDFRLRHLLDRSDLLDVRDLRQRNELFRQLWLDVRLRLELWLREELGLRLRLRLRLRLELRFGLRVGLDYGRRSL